VLVIRGVMPDERGLEWLRPAGAGALVAAGLRTAAIEGKVFIEPFFSTSKLWALSEFLRMKVRSDNAGFWRWAWPILGISPDRAEDRSYADLLRADAPIVAVMGDIPLLPPRMVVGLPSLTDDDDRGLLLAAGARIVTASGGHGVPLSDPDAVARALDMILAEVAGQPSGTTATMTEK
jgi:hypothetical protein